MKPPHPDQRTGTGAAQRRRARVGSRLGARALLLLVLGVPGCGGGGAAPDPEPTGLSPLAAAYLDDVLDIMEQNSVRRREIDWPDFRRQVIARAGTAQTTSDTYEAIRFAVTLLGDGHSVFLTAQEAAERGLRPAPPGPAGTRARPAPRRPPPPGPRPAPGDPTGLPLGNGLAYMNVPAFSGSGAESTRLVDTYYATIDDLDPANVCGWVIDLRGNFGGNMWPMLAGLGPVLGDGVLGFFVDPDSLVQTWTYTGEAAALDGQPLAAGTSAHPTLDPLPPVAVLTDGETASSGEAVVIAFRGRPDTRSFGVPTAGLSTSNRGFWLSDGALLLLSVSWMADRTGRIYGAQVQPDSLVPGIRTGDVQSDAPLRAGVEWLRAQAACGG